MKMSERLPQSDLLPMELPSMSSAGASHAKTLAQPEKAQGLQAIFLAEVGGEIRETLTGFAPE